MPNTQKKTEEGRPLLLPYPEGTITGVFLERRKRFSVACIVNGERIWIHSNNTGSMIGLLRAGSSILMSRSSNPKRKLPYTLEAVRIGGDGRQGFWAGVNTLVPNRLLEAAFKAGLLPFASGYTALHRECQRADSRFDGLLQGQGLPDLWIECKNVTLVEDEMALFPDSVTERGLKHLTGLMKAVRSGCRAAMLYVIQRPDGKCFAPADFIDPAYAHMFHEALHAGVEIYTLEAAVTPAGIHYAGSLPLARCLFQ